MDLRHGTIRTDLMAVAAASTLWEGPSEAGWLLELANGRSSHESSKVHYHVGLVGIRIELARLTETPNPRLGSLYACTRLLAKTLSDRKGKRFDGLCRLPVWRSHHAHRSRSRALVGKTPTQSVVATWLQTWSAKSLPDMALAISIFGQDGE
jgi:hypothetical protein